MSENQVFVGADPDALISAIAKRKGRQKGGRLHLFIGMAPGVGKTYAMLLAAREAKRSGIDVVVGVVETHGRKETEQLLDGLEVIPKKKLVHRDVEFLEMDIDAILDRRPHVVLVDELAHTNIPGSRHQKRWQDVFELLDAGIDVYSTVNIQHLESRKDAVEKIANITVSETLPDSVIDRAFQIQLIDLSVPDLLRRLKEGKVYLGEKADHAAANFFKEEKLTALREIALRVAAERVDAELQTFATEREAGTYSGASDRLLVAIGFSISAETIIRAARRLAYNLDAPWIAVHVSSNELASENDKALLKKNLDLARNLGAEVVTIADTNVVDAIMRVAQQKDVSQIIIGRSKKRFLRDVFGRGSIHDQLIEKSGVDICVLGPKSHKMTTDFFDKIRSIKIQSTLGSFTIAFFYTCAMLASNMLLSPFIGYRQVGFLFLLGILVLGLFLPLGSVLFASIATMLGWNFFFIPPVGTFHIEQPEDIFLCLSFLVAALATGILTRRIKYQQDILINRELRVQTLNQILLDIATATATRDLCTSVIKRINAFLKGDCDIVLLKKDRDLSAFVGKTQFENLSRELAVAKWSIENNKAAGRFTTTLSSAEALYIPLKGSFETMGALAYRAKNTSTLSLEDMDFLFSVAHQVAISLEKQKFRQKALAADQLAESAKMQQTLLELLAKEVKTALGTHGLHAKLGFSIDNFLLASRLSAGVFPLRKEPCEIKELVGAAIKRVQGLFPEPINIVIHGDGEFSKIDVEKESFALALANILLNAQQYAPKKQITVEMSPQKIIISDQGPGVKEEDLSHIFEKPPKESHMGGHGLGLWIAKGIVRAHEGKIFAENRASGGLEIVVEFPVY